MSKKITVEMDDVVYDRLVIHVIGAHHIDNIAFNVAESFVALIVQAVRNGRSEIKISLNQNKNDNEGNCEHKR